MKREYVPVPIDYLIEMEPLSDEDFGRLIRALLRHSRDGSPVELDGDCRFYCGRVMLKDQYYAEKFAEEDDKAARRSGHARRAAMAKYEGQEPYENCPGMPEDARADNTNTIQYKSIQNNSNQFNGISGSAEPEETSAAAPAIPLVDGSEYCVKVKELEEWKKAFPAVDVVQELGEMRTWCLSNPTLRKTQKGVRRFINTWLSKEQDRRHTGQTAVKPQPERVFIPSEF